MFGFSLLSGGWVKRRSTTIMITGGGFTFWGNCRSFCRKFTRLDFSLFGRSMRGRVILNNNNLRFDFPPRWRGSRAATFSLRSVWVLPLFPSEVRSTFIANNILDQIRNNRGPIFRVKSGKIPLNLEHRLRFSKNRGLKTIGKRTACTTLVIMGPCCCS